MLWKKTIEKDLLCPQNAEWLVEVTIPVIQAIPPPCLKEKEQFCCCNNRITGALESQVATECWDLLKGKVWDVREGMAVGRWCVDRVFLLAWEPSLGLSWAPCWLKSDIDVGFLHGPLFTLCSTSFGIWSWIRISLWISLSIFLLTFSSFKSSEKIVNDNNNNNDDPCQVTLGQTLQFSELFILPIYTRFLTLT